jgi:hypothetical protein
LVTELLSNVISRQAWWSESIAQISKQLFFNSFCSGINYETAVIVAII